MTEERIKELATYFYHTENFHFTEGTEWCKREEVDEYIRTVAAEAREEGIEPAWIEVRNRCPEEAESVLVTWFKEGMAKPAIMCGHYIADPGEITWFQDWTAEVIQPTHWMPLPKPPTKRLKEKE